MFKRNAYEARIAELEARLLAQKAATIDTLNAMQARFLDRAALMAINSEGRRLRFTFVRNNTVINIDCMGTWDDDVDEWRQMLLEPSSPTTGMRTHGTSDDVQG